MEKPTLVYDSDCDFCKFWVGKWKDDTDHVKFEGSDKAIGKYPDLSKEELSCKIHLIKPNGKKVSGAEAVLFTISRKGLGKYLYWSYKNVPGFSKISEFIYSLVSKNRYSLLPLLKIFASDNSYNTSSWIFIRLLAIIYLVAFVSSFTQLPGLIGQNGIVPVDMQLKNLGGFSFEKFLTAPTTAWITGGEGIVQAGAFFGLLLAPLIIIGIFSTGILFLLWLFYLSIVSVGGNFFAFQWDSLLLEAGFLSLFLFPVLFIPKFYKNLAPSKIVVFLFQLLLFKLVFMSGAAKILSDDPTWRNLTALTFHFETQPLPTILGWYANLAPIWFLKLSTLSALFIENILPFFIFGPRPFKIIAFLGINFLMILIMLTGNYTFFNLLAISFSLFLIDDGIYKKLLPNNLFTSLNAKNKIPPKYFAPRAILLVVLVIVNVLIIIRLFVKENFPNSINQSLLYFATTRVASSYGLFSVMTTVRNEIVIEGSNDKKNWLAYRLPFKPQELSDAPKLIEPFQPRLDWQMWFAALSDYRQNPWFVNLMIRLLQGSPDVEKLFVFNPFPNSPPKYIRASYYNYTFTNFDEKKKTGNFWIRKYLRLYFPEVGFSR